MEGALADDIFGNADSTSAGRVARRQTSGTFDADVRNDYMSVMYYTYYRGKSGYTLDGGYYFKHKYCYEYLLSIGPRSLDQAI